MDQLRAYELFALLRFYSNLTASKETAERILEIAKALKARVLEDSK